MSDNERRYFEHDASYEEWLDWYHRVEHDRYEHPDVTVDAVMMTYDDEAKPVDSLKTLLIRRYTHPYKGLLSLPGTFTRHLMMMNISNMNGYRHHSLRTW